MKDIMPFFCLFCSLVCFLLGLLYKIVQDAKADMVQSMHDLKTLLVKHVHDDDGAAVIRYKKSRDDQ